MRKNEWWCVKDRHGDFDIDSFRSVRRDAIDVFCTNWNPFFGKPSWGFHKKFGYRCVKIRVEEIRK